MQTPTAKTNVRDTNTECSECGTLQIRGEAQFGSHTHGIDICECSITIDALDTRGDCPVCESVTPGRREFKHGHIAFAEVFGH